MDKERKEPLKIQFELEINNYFNEKHGKKQLATLNVM